MLTDLSDALARHVFSRLAPDRAHPRADLDRLPPLLAHALRRRLDREVATRLDDAAPWVSSVPDLWREDADVEPRFPADAWAPIARETCEWVVEALVHPADALPARLPESGDTSTEEVLDRMRDLGAYPYLAELVERYAEKKRLAGYDRDTLHRFLDRVDRRIAAELDTEGWRALLVPLFDLAEAVPEFFDGVPGRILAEVFAARGRPGLGADVLSRERVGLDELMGLVDAALAPEPEEAPEPDGPEVLEAAFPVATAGEPDDNVTDAVEVEAPEEEEAPAPDESRLVEQGTAEEERATETTTAEASPVTWAEALASSGSATHDEEDAPRTMTLADALAASPPESQEEAAREEADGRMEAPTPPPSSADEEAADEPEPLPLTELVDPEPVSAPESAEASSAPDRATVPGEVTPPAVDPMPDDAPAPDDEPLWARLARERGTSLDALAEAPDEETLDEEADEPLWRRFAAGGEAPPRDGAPPRAEGAPPVSSSTAEEVEARVLGVSADKRATYVGALFQGDEEAYHRVLRLLDGASSWTEATEIIGREVFLRYHVHIYSDPAASFTDAVERRYSGG